MNYHHRIIIVLMRGDPIRIHTMLFREVLMAIGYNLSTAQKITQKTFVRFFKDKENESEVVIEKEAFNDYLNEIHLKNKLETVKRLRNYFYAIIRLRLKQKGVIILLGGASGCGKSSLTSLLAGRLHLREMSSDNIRHIMRNFITKKESPFIFSSTYDSDHLITDPNMTLQEKCIEAYLRQCHLVQKELKKVLDYYYRTGVWVIVEGVHITPDFIIECMKSYDTCFGCIVYVEDAEKYKNRFASRSSKNSIKPEDNKYIQGFEKIMMIQSYLIKQAEEKLIPQIHNTNLDTSYCLVHRSFLKNFKLITKEKPLIDAQADNAAMFHSEFLRTKVNLSKAKKIRDYMKMGKVEKEENRGQNAVTGLSKPDLDPDGSLTLARVNELKPITRETRHHMVVLPKIPSDGQIKTIIGLIKKGNPEDPIKLHWVGTDRRTLIFKTDINHVNDIFLYDFVMDKSETVQNVVTDPISKEKFFNKAMDSPLVTHATPGMFKSMKKPMRKDNDSDASFESNKDTKGKRSSIKNPVQFTDLKQKADQIDAENGMDNSIDKLDSDDDSQNKEVGRFDLDL